MPWVVYQRTGDLGLLARQLPSMRAWVDRIAALAGDDRLWTGGFQFGDWLDPTAPPDAPFEAKADPDVVATAHLARSAEVVSAAAAAVVGDADIAEHYARLAAEVREAFAREYVTARRPGAQRRRRPCTRWRCEWSLLPDRGAARAGRRRLADLVRTSGFRISTGFVGTPLIADALTCARPRRRGLPAAAADRLPVLAVRGDDGRDHGLGALGQPCCPTAPSTRAR